MSDPATFATETPEEAGTSDYVGELQNLDMGRTSPATHADETQQVVKPEWPRELPGIGLLGPVLALVVMAVLGYAMVNLAGRLRETADKPQAEAAETLNGLPAEAPAARSSNDR